MILASKFVVICYSSNKKRIHPFIIQLEVFRKNLMYILRSEKRLEMEMDT